MSWIEVISKTHMGVGGNYEESYLKRLITYHDYKDGVKYHYILVEVAFDHNDGSDGSTSQQKSTSFEAGSINLDFDRYEYRIFAQDKNSIYKIDVRIANEDEYNDLFKNKYFYAKTFKPNKFAAAPIIFGIEKRQLNESPIIIDNTSNNRTLYEGDTITLNGNIKDKDKGDVVTVRYSIDNGTTKALSSNISQGRDIPYNKALTFKEGYLYDGSSKVSNKLSDGTKHLIKIWAEDDSEGKSEKVLVNFYVVNNRPASLNINSMVEQIDLIDTDTYLITGSVKDPDGNETTLSYKVNSSSYSTINSGKDRDFEVRIPVSRFNEGNNTVTFRAKDTYGAITERVAKITKDKNITQLKTAIREYKMLPPEGKAKGILLWVQRETGDLTTKVEIKFGSSPYKTLESDNTAPVGVGIEEDEYYYENDKEESDIRLRITMERSSLSSTKGIKLISGVFN